MTHSPEYRVWNAMIERCTKPSTKYFEYYGGRGIKVCDRWLRGDGERGGFQLFIADMGRRPSAKHSIERINNSKGYEPGNVRWATSIEQANNKSTNRVVTYRHRRMTVAEAVRLAGSLVQRETAICRLNNGWSISEAVETPPLYRRDPLTWRKIGAVP
jgi:hypothetical protein